MNDGFWERHRHPDMSNPSIAQSVLSEWEDERILNRMRGDQLQEKWAPIPFAPVEREDTELECGCIFDPMLVDGKPKMKCCKCGKVI